MAEYRDPHPDEIQQDEGVWIKMLPPERQAFWRQVTDDVPAGYPADPRYARYSSALIEADVRAYQNGLLCSAMKDMAEQARLLREALEK